ncbi:MAG: DUF2520 domain-containing protein [Vicingaceae bacterium]
MKAIKLGIIGSGNLGVHLCRAFSSSNDIDVTLFSRSGQNTGLINDLKNVVIEIDQGPLTNEYDVLILAVNDSSIQDVAAQNKENGALVLHASGSTDISAIGAVREKDYGVIYPLQTFHIENELTYADIPFLIEADSVRNLALITRLVELIGAKVHIMSSENRRIMHLSAVIVNNFSNHLYALSELFLTSKDLPFDLLLPLINETANGIGQRRPSEIQTGPAKRGDKQTIERHLYMLKENSDLKKIYHQMTLSIEALYRKR